MSLTTFPFMSSLYESCNILFRSGRSGTDIKTNSVCLKLDLGLSLATTPAEAKLAQLSPAL